MVGPKCYGLEDGCEGCDPNAGADENGVLRSVDVAGGRTKRTVDHNLNQHTVIVNSRGSLDSYYRD